MLNKLIMLCGGAACALLASCATDFASRNLDQELADQRQIVTRSSLAELANLEPQLTAPFRLGVAPPVERKVGTWTDDEVERIRSWGAKLQEAGLISDMVFLSNMLVVDDRRRSSGGLLHSIRRAAMREGADAVLVISSVTGSGSGVNPLALLDLTIVGMFIFPGHDTESRTIMEGMVFDTRNEFLYMTARGQADLDDSTAFAYVDKNMRRQRERARLKAIDSLGRSFLEQSTSMGLRIGGRKLSQNL